MANIVFMFPGQGAQKVGMGKDFYDNYPECRSIYEQACEVSDLDLIRYSHEGPQETLNLTEVCQPAILATSIAAVAALKSELGVASRIDGLKAALGLSLGEYTALVMIGALDFADAVSLVTERGRLMQEACETNPGSMASIIGLSREKCEEACRIASEYGHGVVANINSPVQIAISGEHEALEKACELAKEYGARRVIPLAVSGAFHSPCMAPAAEGLLAKLADTKFKTPYAPVVSNARGAYLSIDGEIRSALADQLLSPVEWLSSIELLRGDGAETFVEPAPGRVLQGLVRKIDGEADVCGFQTVEEMVELLRSGVFK